MPELIINGLNFTEFSEHVAKTTRFTIGRGLENIEKIFSAHGIDKDSDLFVELRKLYMDVVNEHSRRILGYFLKDG